MSPKTNNANPDITIYRGWKDEGKHVWSPFVIKLEARLRFARVPYATEAGSPKTAPKGKIPYIECTSPHATTHSASSKVQLSDSTLIIKTLTEWNTIPDINARLSPPMRAHDLALRALLEDKQYFYHTCERWCQNYYTMRDHVLWSLPHPVRVVVGLMIYRHTVATLHGQGTGRLSAEEMAAFLRENWESINDLLLHSRAKQAASTERPFWVLAGEEPTEADATVFGFVVSVLLCDA